MFIIRNLIIGYAFIKNEYKILRLSPYDLFGIKISDEYILFTLSS